MTIADINVDARRLITERCLIAADVDKTILDQGSKRERETFLRSIGPQLLEAVANGTHLALLTGNSMEELCSRVLFWLIEQLCHIDNLQLLHRLHFFCNSGGVYIHFCETDPALQKLYASSGAKLDPKEIFAVLTTCLHNRTIVHSRFIDSAFLTRTRIPDGDVLRIKTILDDEAAQYLRELQADCERLAKSYDLRAIRNGDDWIIPSTDLRVVEYGALGESNRGTVQMTLKPILSFQHGLHRKHMFARDLRGRMVNTIQARLDSSGMGHYVARPGGRSSIDVTLDKLDKAYALEFLIDHLNLQGQPRRGQKFGSNAIYFGDEVMVGGGNDYPVTRIPGLLVFAVNPDKELIPFLYPVFVPSAILDGPDATSEVISQYNRCAVSLLTKFRPHGRSAQSQTMTAIELLKHEIFTTRIKEKLESLVASRRASVDDWQTLHTFLTLMSRDDASTRQWLNILIHELDTIMADLASAGVKRQPALGASRPPD